jgi:hypothetical protein
VTPRLRRPRPWATVIGLLVAGRRAATSRTPGSASVRGARQARRIGAADEATPGTREAAAALFDNLSRGDVSGHFSSAASRSVVREAGIQASTTARRYEHAACITPRRSPRT